MSSSAIPWTGKPNLAESSPRILSYPFNVPWYERTNGRGGTGRTRGYAILKRALDVVLASLALPIIVPVILVAGLAIRIDSPGAPFFSQSRTGKNGRRFKMFKLRTMSQNAEHLKEKYRHLNELQWPDFKIPNDPRITRVGHFLRRTSIDELPQILNVLIGDMSFVGPRPTSFDLSRYRLWHTARLSGKPGLTGLWQVSGRNELEFDERVRLDVAYLRHESFALDFWILLRTFGAVLSGRGAN